MPTDRNDGDAMLRRMIAEAQQALESDNPQARAKIIAEQLQGTAGWALRWAVDDLRYSGLSWQAISLLLQRPHQVLLRQMAARGPVYLHRPAYSQASRNFDGQTPMRRAGIQLADRMAALLWTNPNSAVTGRLWPNVQALSKGQGIAPDPEPMLAGVRALLDAVDAIPPGTIAPAAELTQAESDVWEAVDELRACYHRDQAEMKIAHHILTEVAPMPGKRPQGTRG